MGKTQLFRHLLTLLFAGVVLAAIVQFSAWIVAPDMSIAPPQYSDEEIRQAKQWRNPELSQDDTPVIHREVDYAQGQSANWYPKGESPILADAVTAGKLASVTERVGPEPVVVGAVEGIGRYGGTWYRVANAESDVSVIENRLSYATLVRWSPHGYPLVPHIARSWDISDNNRQFIFHLRKGMKWSDGHPFTANDIMFWWNHEANDRFLRADVAEFMKINGKKGNIEKIDDYTVKFTFPEPHGLFLAHLATYQARVLANFPEHYLRKYHPTLGDQELIKEIMDARSLASPRAVYRDMALWNNPECPRLWPWVYRSYKANPPFEFVRNPYFFMVDTRGNQLPYLDRMLIDVKTEDMIGVTASSGELSMQARHIRYEDYTLFMSEHESKGYDVYHWYPADRSVYSIYPNHNRIINPDASEAKVQEAKWKRQFLQDKHFKQALSLAINRQPIIDAEYNGQGKPAQLAPGPSSYFYHPKLLNAFIEYDPDSANKILDRLGLDQYDYEGYRKFPDGSRMSFFLDFTSFTGEGPAQFLIDDWAKVGVRVVPRERHRSLFYNENYSRKGDLVVWIGYAEYLPILEPKSFLPLNNNSFFAKAWGNWYRFGGLQGNDMSKFSGIEAPDKNHPIYHGLELYNRACNTGDLPELRKYFNEIFDIASENLWCINISTPPPTLALVQKNFHNVPKSVVATWTFQTPGNAGMETYYYDDHEYGPGEREHLIQAVTTVTPRPGSTTLAKDSRGISGILSSIIKWSIISIVLLGIVLIALRHPYIGRRILIMGPTMLIISVVAFVVIQLPPGDFIQTKITMLQERGDQADFAEIEELREIFNLEQPMVTRYCRWLGLSWFMTFQGEDKGLLQGHLGLSMADSRPVNEKVGDRIILTILISLGTILFTWLLAIPIGIYSAVKQYSIADYFFTLLGFIGMCVPAFLVALVLIHISEPLLGIRVSGLFSAQYAAQPDWTWGKFVDLLKHIWIPIVVLGLGGTAWMIRVMRGNLLDELKKPYVVTARAKGVRPMKLLLKYPVRLALNPFVSGIGQLFPQLISGGAIVAMVLSLPTVGPMMLSALLNEDMYLAGSLLMVLSLLGVIGTLVSDILLLWLDPRIRYQGGGK